MSSQSPRAAGGPAALAILGGVGVGAVLGQPTAGFFIGLGIGIALLVGVWLIDRR